MILTDQYHFHLLPPAVRAKIFSFLDVEDLGRGSSVCKQWRKFIFLQKDIWQRHIEDLGFSSVRSSYEIGGIFTFRNQWAAFKNFRSLDFFEKKFNVNWLERPYYLAARVCQFIDTSKILVCVDLKGNQTEYIIYDAEKPSCRFFGKHPGKGIWNAANSRFILSATKSDVWVKPIQPSRVDFHIIFSFKHPTIHFLKVFEQNPSLLLVVYDHGTSFIIFDLEKREELRFHLVINGQKGTYLDSCLINGNYLLIAVKAAVDFHLRLYDLETSELVMDFDPFSDVRCAYIEKNKHMSRMYIRSLNPHQFMLIDELTCRYRVFDLRYNQFITSTSLTQFPSSIEVLSRKILVLTYQMQHQELVRFFCFNTLSESTVSRIPSSAVLNLKSGRVATLDPTHVHQWMLKVREYHPLEISKYRIATLRSNGSNKELPIKRKGSNR